MSLEDKLNSSFLEKLRNSITRPFIPLITATTIALTGCNSVNGSNQDQISCLSDYDCYGEKVCIEKKCIELSNNSEYIGDIEVTFSKSNQEGLALFVDNQTGEEVKIYVKDELNVPIENANVAFWDGDGFETFQVDHPDYTPLIEIFSHNSSHHLTLTTSPLQFNPYFNSDDYSNNNSEIAARKFSNYVKENSQVGSCITLEEFKETRIERQAALINFTNLIPNVGDDIKDFLTITSNLFFGTVENIIDKLQELGYDENNCQYFRSWNGLRPSEQVFSPIFNYDCMQTIPSERCDNGIDDDCDGQIDLSDSDCEDYINNNNNNNNGNNNNNNGEECSLTSGCNDDDCIFYDSFNGDELDQCKWPGYVSPSEDYSLINGKLRFFSVNPNEVGSLISESIDANLNNNNFKLEFKEKLSSENVTLHLSFGDLRFAYNWVTNPGELVYTCQGSFPLTGLSPFNPTQLNSIKFVKKNNFLDIHINGSLFDSRDCGNYFLNDNSHMFDIKCYSENSEDYCELDEFKLTYD